MSTTKFHLKTARWELFLGLALVAVAAWQLLRSFGKYPVVFADEMLYSAYSRLTPLAEVNIPSYLYFATYRLTSAFGDAFLEAARVFNTLFLVGAAPFIYLIARRLVPRPLAVLVALLAVCAPFNSFATYFMPETMYFFAFYVLTWLALQDPGRRWALQAAGTGALLGLMTMIKIHALFLMPALALFAAYSAYGSGAGARPLARALAAGAIAAAATLAVRLGGGMLVVGADGLHLLGSFYGNHADSTAHNALLALLAPAWINLRGHAMALALCFGVPMAVLAQALASARARAAAGAALTRLHAYTGLMLGAAVAMTIAYTATLAPYGVNEGLRLHQRYYDFAFPLLYLVAAAALDKAWRGTPAMPARLAAFLIAAASLLALVKLPTYRLVMIDTPEVASLFLSTEIAIALGIGTAGALALWAWRPRAGAMLYLYALAPLFALQGAFGVALYQHNVNTPNLFDRAGKFAHATVPAAERDAMLIAGTDLGELMRAKFHVDARGVTLLELARGEAFDIARLPVRQKWLLVVGEHALPAVLKPVAPAGPFALVRIGAFHQRLGSAAFDAKGDEHLVASVSGLSDPEDWGRWSDAKEVAIRFKTPFPKQLSLVLKVQAYGPNTGQEFIARVGDAERRFRVGPGRVDIYLPFDTDGTQDTLRITVPQPTAPAPGPGAGDHRELGLGLLELEIGHRPGQ